MSPQEHTPSALTGSEAPQQPLMLREIETSLERQPCPSCSARNVFLTHTVMNNDARQHVECRICSMRGPVKYSEVEAVDAWNKLPRVEADGLAAAETDHLYRILSALTPGYVLVPVEPTLAMVEAGAVAIDALWSDGQDRGPAFAETEREYQAHCRSTAQVAFRAMLAKAKSHDQ